MTLKDAEKALSTELEALIGTIPLVHVEHKEAFAQEMDAFKNLFSRYLHLTSETLDWSKIEPIPSECVKN